MGGVKGAARRTAVVHQDARYGPRQNDQDGLYLDNARLKGQIIAGEFHQDMLWTAIAWSPALLLYSTSIPKPSEVLKQSVAEAPDPLRIWAADI